MRSNLNLIFLFLFTFSKSVFAEEEIFEFDLNHWIVMTGEEGRAYPFTDWLEIPPAMRFVVHERETALCQLRWCGEFPCSELVQSTHTLSAQGGELIKFSGNSFLPRIRTIPSVNEFFPHVFVTHLTCKAAGVTALELEQLLDSMMNEKRSNYSAHILFSMYQDFVFRKTDPFFSDLMKEILSRQYIEEPLKKLTVDFLDSELIQIYNKNKIIQLRKIDKTIKKLIVGCGNRPLAYIGNLLVRADDVYSDEHAHADSITIDPDLLKNATLVAEFGLDPLFDFLPGGHFDEIIFEGYFPVEVNDIQKTLQEVHRLLSPQGHAYLYDGDYWHIDVPEILQLIQENPWVSSEELKDMVYDGCSP